MLLLIKGGWSYCFVFFFFKYPYMSLVVSSKYKRIWCNFTLKLLGNRWNFLRGNFSFWSLMRKVTFVLTASKQCVKTTDHMVFTWKRQCIIYVKLLIGENTKILNSSFNKKKIYLFLLSTPGNIHRIFSRGDFNSLFIVMLFDSNC